ncbi:MAG TPA: hypothetical protein VM266_08265 [Solirubrobacteraceae bacterium]|nr:hypothetical protein [Solirubrobacteraceae bacterium]
MPAWPLALACLPAGFAVADATGVRPLGGAVMALLALGALALARAPLPRAAAWAGLTFACFVASHLIAGALGTWGAVALVAAVAGAAGALLLDRRPQTA